MPDVKPNTPQDLVLNARDAADYLGCHIGSIGRWRLSKKLKASRFWNRTFWYSVIELDKLKSSLCRENARTAVNELIAK